MQLCGGSFEADEARAKVITCRRLPPQASHPREAVEGGGERAGVGGWCGGVRGSGRGWGSKGLDLVAPGSAKVISLSSRRQRWSGT